MNPDRRKKVVALPDTLPQDGWMGVVRKHLNTALTIILVIAAIAMLIRWRINTAAIAKQSVANELVNARNQVSRLRSGQFGQVMPAELIKAVQTAQTQANAAIASVLNSSDADAAMRAEALTLRGDLYWYLANIPDMPGATTQPALRLGDSSDVYLQKASDSYQELTKNSTYADQHESLAIAHLGLAAIAENRGNWAAAETELKTVVNDTSTLSALVDQAKLQLQQLPILQQQTYVAPPTGTAHPATAPIPMEPMGPIAPVMTTQPATTQASH